MIVICGTAAAGEWKEPQSWQVLKAVETKDVMFLMEVRDRAFHVRIVNIMRSLRFTNNDPHVALFLCMQLLLRRTGDATPLLHAIRIGASHKEVAIILTGAMSRFVNHLEDEDMDKPRTKSLLKALRAFLPSSSFPFFLPIYPYAAFRAGTNLKLAIDSSLLLDQPDLVASFLQTLVMSEGDRWLSNQIYLVSLALRSPVGEGKPVHVAGEAVRGFATRELGKASGKIIAALED